MHFSDVLEATDRSDIAQGVQQARKEFQTGRCSPSTLGDILKSILS
jgi:hypothetical protein